MTAPGSKKGKFTLSDRINIVQILPQKDNFERLIIREEILDMVKITSAEIEKHQIQTSDAGGVSWKDNGASWDYDFNGTQANYLRDNLKNLSEKKELDAALINIYKIFV